MPARQAMPPLAMKPEDTVGEFKTDKLIIRYVLGKERDPRYRDDTYVAWQSHLRIGDSLVMGTPDRGTLGNFLRKLAGSVVGTEKEISALIVKIDNDKPLTLFSAKVTNPVGEQVGDYSDGNLAGGYRLVSGQPRPLSITASATVRTEYDARLPGNLIKLTKFVGSLAAIPTGAASFIFNSVVDIDIHSANAAVSEMLNEGGKIGDRTLVLTDEQARRVKLIQIVLFDKSLINGNAKYIGSIDINPVFANSLITQERNYSALNRDLIYRKIHDDPKVVYADFISEQTRASMLDPLEAMLGIVCADTRKTFTGYEFSPNDVAALMWASLRSSRSFSAVSARGNYGTCPDGDDIKRFAQLELSWPPLPDDPTGFKAQVNTTLTILAGRIKSGFPMERFFSANVNFFQSENVTLSKDDSIPVGTQTKLEPVRISAILTKIKAPDRSVGFGNWSFSVNSAQAYLMTDQKCYAVSLTFDPEGFSVPEGTVRKINEILIVPTDMRPCERLNQNVA